MTGMRNFTRQYAIPLWPWYLLGLIFLAITNAITVEIPSLAAKVTDQFARGDRDVLATWAMTIVALGIAQIISRSLSRIFIFWPGRAMEASAKADLFSQSVRLSKAFLDTVGVGDLISRFTHDLGQLRAFFAFGVLQIFNFLFLFCFTVNQMWETNQKLTIASLSPILLLFVISRFISPKISLYNRRQQKAIGELTNKVTEAFSHVLLIQTNAAEEIFSRRCDPEAERVFQASMKLIFLRTVVFPLVGSLATISQVIVLFVGGNEVLAGRLTVGDILAFNVYLVTIAFPMTSLGIIISLFFRAKAALERLNLIKCQSQEGSKKGLQNRSPKFLLEVRDLTFSYPKTSKNEREQALRNLNFHIEQGEKIGICGAMGSGKSTLFHLITRLYNPPAGTIFFYGQDILAIEPAVLRRKISYALQDSYLFSDTISSNLIFGKDREISTQEMEDAIARSAVVNDINSFPHGLATQIGEKGVRLSGGQKQRIALARLFLKGGDIWLLDDVLSAVDSPTEKKIISNLFESPATLMLTTHRQSSLQLCDRVFYMKNGQIIDEGKFQELQQRHDDLINYGGKK